MGDWRVGRLAVAQPSFLVDRLGQDCRAEQFLRELTQNSIEAIIRTGGPGEIVWQTVPSFFFPESRQFGSKLSISDNGDGMTGEQMEKLINQLSASGSQQSLGGNYGVGAKIATASRNPAGVIYQSWKHGEGHQVWLCRDEASGRYGLRQFSIDIPGISASHLLSRSACMRAARQAVCRRTSERSRAWKRTSTTTRFTPRSSSSPEPWLIGGFSAMEAN
jgi:hypothetical protein